MSSTCLEPEGSSSGRQLYIQVRYSVFNSLVGRLLIVMHVKYSISYLYIQPSSWRWTLSFETYRRHQKIKNWNINLENVHFVGLYFIIIYIRQVFFFPWTPTHTVVNPVTASWNKLNILCPCKWVLFVKEEYNFMVNTEGIICTTGMLTL
jgi:hypothetical protein